LLHELGDLWDRSCQREMATKVVVFMVECVERGSGGQGSKAVPIAHWFVGDSLPEVQQREFRRVVIDALQKHGGKVALSTFDKASIKLAERGADGKAKTVVQLARDVKELTKKLTEAQCGAIFQRARDREQAERLAAAEVAAVAAAAAAPAAIPAVVPAAVPVAVAKAQQQQAAAAPPDEEGDAPMLQARAAADPAPASARAPAKQQQSAKSKRSSKKGAGKKQSAASKEKTKAPPKKPSLWKLTKNMDLGEMRALAGRILFKERLEEEAESGRDFRQHFYLAEVLANGDRLAEATCAMHAIKTLRQAICSGRRADAPQELQRHYAAYLAVHQVDPKLLPRTVLHGDFAQSVGLAKQMFSAQMVATLRQLGKHETADLADVARGFAEANDQSGHCFASRDALMARVPAWLGLGPGTTFDKLVDLFYPVRKYYKGLPMATVSGLLITVASWFQLRASLPGGRLHPRIENTDMLESWFSLFVNVTVRMFQLKQRKIARTWLKELSGERTFVSKRGRDAIVEAQRAEVGDAALDRFCPEQDNAELIAEGRAKSYLPPQMVGEGVAPDIGAQAFRQRIGATVRSDRVRMAAPAKQVAAAEGKAAAADGGRRRRKRRDRSEERAAGGDATSSDDSDSDGDEAKERSAKRRRVSYDSEEESEGEDEDEAVADASDSDAGWAQRERAQQAAVAAAVVHSRAGRPRKPTIAVSQQQYALVFQSSTMFQERVAPQRASAAAAAAADDDGDEDGDVDMVPAGRRPERAPRGSRAHTPSRGRP
jgi:hypothetical protein